MCVEITNIVCIFKQEIIDNLSIRYTIEVSIGAYAAVQSQKAVPAYSTSKQLLPFVFAEQFASLYKNISLFYVVYESSTIWNMHFSLIICTCNLLQTLVRQMLTGLSPHWLMRSHPRSFNRCWWPPRYGGGEGAPACPLSANPVSRQFGFSYNLISARQRWTDCVRNRILGKIRRARTCECRD